MSRSSTFTQATTSATPATNAAKSTASGIASQTVERAPGMKRSERTIRITSITANVIACVATTENATSCRGNLHLLDQLRAVDHRAGARLQRDREEDPAGDPGQQVERVVRHAGVVVEDHAEHEQVHGHQRERVDERPEDAERRSPVFRLEVALEEVREELAVANEIGVHRHERSVGPGYADPGASLAAQPPETPGIEAFSALRAIPSPHPPWGRGSEITVGARCPSSRKRHGRVPSSCRFLHNWPKWPSRPSEQGSGSGSRPGDPAAPASTVLTTC